MISMDMNKQMARQISNNIISLYLFITIFNYEFFPFRFRHFVRNIDFSYQFSTHRSLH